MVMALSARAVQFSPFTSEARRPMTLKTIAIAPKGMDQIKKPMIDKTTAPHPMIVPILSDKVCTSLGKYFSGM